MLCVCTVLFAFYLSALTERHVRPELQPKQAVILANKSILAVSKGAVC